MQLKFLKGTLGLHFMGGGISSEAIRAETGCEALSSR